MHKFLAIALLVVGFWLLHSGTQRRDSLAGVSETARKEIASKLEGEPRVAIHTVFLITGTVLVAAGGAGFFQRQVS